MYSVRSESISASHTRHWWNNLLTHALAEISSCKIHHLFWHLYSVLARQWHIFGSSHRLFSFQHDKNNNDDGKDKSLMDVIIFFSYLRNDNPGYGNQRKRKKNVRNLIFDWWFAQNIEKDRENGAKICILGHASSITSYALRA